MKTVLLRFALGVIIEKNRKKRKGKQAREREKWYARERDDYNKNIIVSVGASSVNR